MEYRTGLQLKSAKLAMSWSEIRVYAIHRAATELHRPVGRGDVDAALKRSRIICFAITLCAELFWVETAARRSGLRRYRRGRTSNESPSVQNHSWRLE